MPKKLTEEQLDRYRHDGFLFPLPGVGADDAARYRGCLEAYEREQGRPITAMDARYKSHILFPWANELVRRPEILDAVEDAIGPDILVWTSTFFVKEPNTPAVTLWHQDWTFFGLRPHEHITAWVALSNASEAAGCMQMVPEAGQGRPMRHRPRADPNSINGGGQRVVEPFDEAKAVHAALRPGEFSLHHTLCVHSSAPNRSDDRRIGLGISYVPARVRHIGTIPVSALLVRGEDRFGHFRREAHPTGDYETDLAAHAAAYKDYRASYNEQVRWHEEEEPRQMSAAE